jgi:hypothetical protein
MPAMESADEFFDSLAYDVEDQVIWPLEPGEQLRVADGLFGSTVIQAVDSVADQMLAHVDGRWPKPGSMNYEQDAKVAELFKAMSSEQRQAVGRLLAETARLVGSSIFLGLEHFGPGRVEMSVRPISRGELGAAVPLEPGEWQQAYLRWEGRFSKRGQT